MSDSRDVSAETNKVEGVGTGIKVQLPTGRISPPQLNNNNNNNIRRSPTQFYNNNRRKPKRTSKKQREETNRVNQEKNERSRENVVQWPPPAHNAPQYSPLCIPSQNIIEKGDNDDQAATSLLENNGLFLIQMPPLPHVNAISNDKMLSNYKNGEVNSNGNRLKMENYNRGRIKNESYIDPTKDINNADEHAQFVGQGATKISSGNEQFLSNLPPGKLGKLRRYKSGKLELLIGDFVFDVTKGPSVHTYREMARIDVKNRKYERLGEVTERLIVSPNINSLLANNKNTRAKQ